MKRARGVGVAQGFALPTVLIASVVMLMVLLAGLVSTSSTSTALQQQYLNRVNMEAAQSGFARASTCLNIYGTPNWSTASPLIPNSTCSGGTQCTTGASCYVLSNTNFKSTFAVNTPTLNTDGSYTVPVASMVQLFRTSVNTQASQTYTKQFYGLIVPTNWRTISAGTWFTCGLTLSTNPTYDKKVKCWGYNGGSYALGNYIQDNSLYPTDVATDGVLNGLSIKKLSTGSSQACVIASDDNAYCWGNNAYGSLGDNTTVQRKAPVAVYRGGVLNGLTVKDIAVGSNGLACAIASDNKAYCWGQNLYGAAGDGTTTQRPAPVAVNSTGVLSGKSLTAIAASVNSPCALDTTGKIYCWGGGTNGQLGNGAWVDSSVPVAVSMNGLTATSIGLGNSFGCMLTSANVPYCWGSNWKGNLGNGTTTSTNTPTPVTTSGALSGKTLTSISVGNTWACVLATDGKAYCWGLIGELSGSNSISSYVPVAINTSGVLSGKTLASISAGYQQTCALDTQGKNYCWGGNPYGEFGNGTATGSINPVSAFSTWRYLQY